MRVVIVGGVAGGASAAARLRRLDEHADIIVLERGQFVSFANCGLPYHIGNIIPSREALLLATPESLRADYDLDIRIRQEVTAIDRERRVVHVHKLDGGENYELGYDKLILAPGAKPFMPPVPGMDLPRVYQLRTIPDMDAIKAEVDSQRAQSAVVIGGGFIGLEMAENLAIRGLQVTLVELLDQVMTPLDPEMAALVHRHLRQNNVRLSLGDGLQSIEAAEGGKLRANLVSGKTAIGDIILVAVGVQPDTQFAREAGLELGPRGHLVVNESLQASDPDIYGIGDAIQVKDPISGITTAIPLAGPANRQGRMAANHIAGRAISYPGTYGSFIAKVLDVVVAAVGLNAKRLTRQGIPFRATITHSADHATYYPGATTMAVKLLCTPDTGRLLGAQVVGVNGVDRTINVLAAALQAGQTVFDLEMLELAYAPPFGSAKDPVNIAGFVAANWLRGDTDIVQAQDLVQRDPDKTGLLDVRTEAEWHTGHLEGAVHIPLAELRDRLGELSRDKEWFIYCRVGKRGYLAERILKQNGYRAANVTGAMETCGPALEAQCNFDDWAPPLVPVALAAAPAVGVTAEGVHIAAMLDACGLQCPGPILGVYREVQKLPSGAVLQVTATDPGFSRDVGAWCQSTGNQLLTLTREGGMLTALIRKGTAAAVGDAASVSVATAPTGSPFGNSHERTIVVFSGDFDRAMAAFIIANGAAATGQKVTLFFTFWGLNILRRDEAVPVQKNLIERMFGWMMPRGVNKLTLSKMNMAGMGTWMMKGVMQAKKVDALPSLIQSARENGVRLIACQMTMDIMGIKTEELIEGVEIGGVATYTLASDNANVNLFI